MNALLWARPDIQVNWTNCCVAERMIASTDYVGARCGRIRESGKVMVIDGLVPISRADMAKV